MPLDVCRCIRRKDNSSLAEFELRLLSKVRGHIRSCQMFKDNGRYIKDDVDLIIEDNQLNANILAKYLSKYGRKCIKVINGYDALDYLSSRSPNIIWCDVKMPVMDGITFAKVAKDKYPHGMGYEGKIIGVTAYADSDTSLACMRAGMDGIVIKPYAKSDLLEHFTFHDPDPDPFPEIHQMGFSSSV